MLDRCIQFVSLDVALMMAETSSELHLYYSNQQGIYLKILILLLLLD